MKRFMHRRFLGIPLALIAAILAVVVIGGGAFAYSQFQSIKVTNGNLFPTTQPAVTSIAITPNSPPNNLEVGGTQQFTATATYNDGDTVDVTATAAWLLGGSHVSQVGGLATGVSVGSATLTASFGGKSGSVTITVIDTHDYTANGTVAVTDKSTVAGNFTVVKSNGFTSSVIYAGKSYEADMVVNIVNNGSTAISGWSITTSGTNPAGYAGITISQTAIAAGASGTVTIAITGTAPATGGVDFSLLICTIIPN
jgi:hypothetical protein